MRLVNRRKCCLLSAHGDVVIILGIGYRHTDDDILIVHGDSTSYDICVAYGEPIRGDIIIHGELTRKGIDTPHGRGDRG